jgi:archaellum biogenesis ATPase FlaH
MENGYPEGYKDSWERWLKEGAITDVGLSYALPKDSFFEEYSPALSHSELMQKEFPIARFTIEPFFEQGTVNMVSAPPNTWKSWLLFLFAKCIVSGTSVFDKFNTEKANVMIVNEEDSLRLIQDRLRLLNITDITLPIYYRVARGTKLTEEFIEDLLGEAEEKSIGVIMFDSLRSIHEADENDSTSMQGVMDHLKKIARKNITVIFTHHNRKKSMFGKGDDAESIRGSSAINAAVSGHISLEENEKDGEKCLVIKHLKSKVGEKIAPFDIGIQTGENISFSFLGDHKATEKALTGAKIKILELLQDRDELLAIKDFIYFKVGGNTTIKEAIKILMKEGKIEMITRKGAVTRGLKILSEKGKSNEGLYLLKKEAHVPMDDSLTTSDEETANDPWLDFS